MKLIVLAFDGFEEIEALTPIDLLRRAGISAELCSMGKSINMTGARNIKVTADLLFENVNDIDSYDGVILPGGLPNAHYLRDDDRVIETVKRFNEKGKLIAAICASPCVLERAGLTRGIAVTSYPGCIDATICDYKETPVVRHENIITSRGVGTAIDFALEIIDYLGGDSDKIAKTIIYKDT